MKTIWRSCIRTILELIRDGHDTDIRDTVAEDDTEDDTVTVSLSRSVTIPH